MNIQGVYKLTTIDGVTVIILAIHDGLHPIAITKIMTYTVNLLIND